MKLAYKLAGPPLLLLLLTVGVTAAQAYVTRAGQRAMEATAVRLQKVGGSIQRVSQLFADAERDLLSHYLGTEELLVEHGAQMEGDVRGALLGLQGADWPPRGESLLRDLMTTHGMMTEARGVFLRESTQGHVSAARSAFIRWWFVAQRANAMLADLSVYNLKRMDHTLGQVREARTRLDLLIFLLTLACAVIATGFAVYVLRDVVRPVVSLTGATRRVGKDEAFQVPRFTQRGDEIGTLADTLFEMTERLTSANRQLESALSARDQFLSIAAHELKTPLTSLSLQVQLLTKSLKGDLSRERLTKAAVGTERLVRRIAQLIDELLDVARLQAGGLELHLEPVQVSELVREVAGRFAHLAESAGSELQLTLDSRLEGMVDASRLDQVLANLIGNAVKYAPGAPIQISLEEAGGWLVLRVEDHGPGVPEEIRTRLFEPYVRAGGSRTGGLGLGLYISRRIVEAHGGSIEVHARSSRGSEFVVRLPQRPVEGVAQRETGVESFAT